MFPEVVAYTSLLYICWMGVATGNSEGMPPPHEESLAVKETIQRIEIPCLAAGVWAHNLVGDLSEDPFASDSTGVAHLAPTPGLTP